MNQKRKFFSPRVAALALSAAVLSQGAAQGADLLAVSPPPPEPMEIGSGWYLRADFTESFPTRPKDATLYNAEDPDAPPLTRLRLSDSPGYGGGVGYRINPWLRVDATFDQRTPSAFSTYSSRTNFATGSNLEAGKLDVLTGLVNVYLDLGTWWGLTPYIGAGVGFADKVFHGAYTQTTCFEEACDGNPGAGPREAVGRPKRGLTSLAWALTGGVSYDFGAGLSLDASYRYVDLGRAKTGVDAYGYATRLKDLSANEVRVGLRYSFASAGSLAPFPRLQGGNPYE